MFCSCITIINECQFLNTSKSGIYIFHIKYIMSRNKFSRAKGVNCNKPLRREYASESTSTNDHVPRGKHEGKFNKKPNGRPPGLKGKEIGLWYRDNARKEVKPPIISLESSMIEDIENDISVAESMSRKDGRSRHSEAKFLREGDINFEEKINSMTVSVIKPNPTLDEELFKEWKERSVKNQGYIKMLKFRQTLPTFKEKDKIIDAINENQIVVISGETGCGKTTQVVQFVLDDFISRKQGSLYKAICTQPRRISAISLAERVAAERGEALGKSVGYQIRLESQLPKRARGTITFATTGILLQRLQSDPILEEFSHLFVDEVHERDTNCDFLITLLKYILPKRPDLKVILMSATINSEKFSEYFDGAPCIQIPGFTYPVEEIYLEDILPKVPFNFPFHRERYHRQPVDEVFKNYVKPYVTYLEANKKIKKGVAIELRNPESERLNVEFIAEVIVYVAKNEEEGAILVFVPGLSQIQDLNHLLSSSMYLPPSKTVIIPMHSIMTSSVQKSAFTVYPKGVRKIIISTSICETSVTIEDVCYVIDCGKSNTQNFDLTKNVETLEPMWETMANVKQKRGRAGRTRPGKYYKLFTRAREETFEEFPLPEIQRSRLEEVILNAKTLNLGRVGPFFEQLLDPPDPKGVEFSLKMLRNLNLLDDNERPTPLGYHVAKLPLDAQTGKMILMGALFSCLDPVLSIAAWLNNKDPFLYIFSKEHLIREKREKFSFGEKSDHFMFSNVVRLWETSSHPREFARENFLSDHNLHFLRNLKKLFAEYLYNMKFLVSADPKDPRSNVNSENVSLIKAVVCSGLYPNVAKVKKIIYSKVTKQPKVILWKTIDHPKVQFHSKSIISNLKNIESPFVVYFEKLKTGEISLYEGTMVHPTPLLFFGEECKIVKNEKYFIEVDEMIKFSCSRRIAELVKKLRNEMEWILQEELLNPGWIDWRKEDRKTLILKSIVKLITSENETAFNKGGVEFEFE